MFDVNPKKLPVRVHTYIYCNVMVESVFRTITLKNLSFKQCSILRGTHMVYTNSLDTRIKKKRGSYRGPEDWLEKHCICQIQNVKTKVIILFTTVARDGSQALDQKYGSSTFPVPCLPFELHLYLIILFHAHCLMSQPFTASLIKHIITTCPIWPMFVKNMLRWRSYST